jgi:hypothetical protein
MVLDTATMTVEITVEGQLPSTVSEGGFVNGDMIAIRHDRRHGQAGRGGHPHRRFGR